MSSFYECTILMLGTAQASLSRVSLFHRCSYFRGIPIQGCTYFKGVPISWVFLFQKWPHFMGSGTNNSGNLVFQGHPYLRCLYKRNHNTLYLSVTTAVHLCSIYIKQDRKNILKMNKEVGMLLPKKS